SDVDDLLAGQRLPGLRKNLRCGVEPAGALRLGAGTALGFRARTLLALRIAIQPGDVRIGARDRVLAKLLGRVLGLLLAAGRLRALGAGLLRGLACGLLLGSHRCTPCEKWFGGSKTKTARHAAGLQQPATRSISRSTSWI